MFDWEVREQKGIKEFTPKYKLIYCIANWPLRNEGVGFKMKGKNHTKRKNCCMSVFFSSGIVNNYKKAVQSYDGSLVHAVTSAVHVVTSAVHVSFCRERV